MKSPENTTLKAVKQTEEKRMKVTIDYDTARVYVPGSDKYLTFKVTGLNDAFLNSSRSRMQAAFRGVRIVAMQPNELVAGSQAIKGSVNEGTNVPKPYEDQAKAFGITVDEFYEAREVARQALLQSFQNRK